MMDPPPNLPPKLIIFFKQVDFKSKVERKKEIMQEQIVKVEKIDKYNTELRKQLEELSTEMVQSVYTELEIKPNDSTRVQQEKMGLADQFIAAIGSLTDWIKNVIKGILSKIRSGIVWVGSKLDDFFDKLVSIFD